MYISCLIFSAKLSYIYIGHPVYNGHLSVFKATSRRVRIFFVHDVGLSSTRTPVNTLSKTTWEWLMAQSTRIRVKKIMRFQICPIPMERALKSQAKNRRSRLTALSLTGFCGTWKNPHHDSKRVRVVDPGGVAHLYGLWDWVGMAPRMGPESRSCTFSLGRPVSRKASE